jgi:hypothetical protein
MQRKRLAPPGWLARLTKGGSGGFNLDCLRLTA